MVDTGSTGAVIASQYFGRDFEPVVPEEKFELVYSSSENAYRGRYVWARIALHGVPGDPHALSPGSVARTEVMRVRMVEQFRAGINGTWSDDPSVVAVAMLGVGFDRDSSDKDSGGFKVPTGLNPFLQIEEMAQGTMARGFYIDLRTPRITLGLTRANTAGFRYLQLQQNCAVTDWIAPTVWLSVPSAHIGPMEMSLLIDTGLGYSIVQAPLGVAPPQSAVQYLVNAHSVAARLQVADEQRVVLAVQGWDAPLYAFEVGRGDQAPEFVSWQFGMDQDGGMPFINTSRHALSQFDYLFDDANGRLGFRSRE
jgi:hypothetical protein